MERSRGLFKKSGWLLLLAELVLAAAEGYRMACQMSISKVNTTAWANIQGAAALEIKALKLQPLAGTSRAPSPFAWDERQETSQRDR